MIKEEQSDPNTRKEKIKGKRLMMGLCFLCFVAISAFDFKLGHTETHTSDSDWAVNRVFALFCCFSSTEMAMSDFAKEETSKWLKLKRMKFNYFVSRNQDL